MYTHHKLLHKIISILYHKYYVYYWYIILCSNTWYIYIYIHIYRHIYVYILLLRLLTSSEICWARRTDTFLSMHSDDGLGMLWRALCSTTAWSWVTWLTWKKKVNPLSILYKTWLKHLYPTHQHSIKMFSFHIHTQTTPSCQHVIQVGQISLYSLILD